MINSSTDKKMTAHCRIFLVLLISLFVLPHSAHAASMGAPCSQSSIGATQLDMSSGLATSVVACLRDANGNLAWRSTMNVPLCPKAGDTKPQILHYDGAQFTCDDVLPAFPTCATGQALTSYNGATFTCVDIGVPQTGGGGGGGGGGGTNPTGTYTTNPTQSCTPGSTRTINDASGNPTITQTCTSTGWQ